MLYRLCSSEIEPRVSSVAGESAGAGASTGSCGTSVAVTNICADETAGARDVRGVLLNGESCDRCESIVWVALPHTPTSSARGRVNTGTGPSMDVVSSDRGRVISNSCPVAAFISIAVVRLCSSKGARFAGGLVDAGLD